jgi:hypothetical protein
VRSSSSSSSSSSSTTRLCFLGPLSFLRAFVGFVFEHLVQFFQGWGFCFLWGECIFFLSVLFSTIAASECFFRDD